MGNLSKNLSRIEFECSCGCHFDTVDFELVNVLQEIVDYFSRKNRTDVLIKITGGNRCVPHNEKIQLKYNKDYIPFTSNSQHLYSRAADFKLFKNSINDKNQISPIAVYDYIHDNFKDRYGLGWYFNRTHLDTRSGNKARWGV